MESKKSDITIIFNCNDFLSSIIGLIILIPSIIIFLLMTLGIILSYINTISVSNLLIPPVLVMIGLIYLLISVDLKLPRYELKDNHIYQYRTFSSTKEKSLKIKEIDEMTKEGKMNKIHKNTPIYIPKRFRKVSLKISRDSRITGNSYTKTEIVISESFYDKIKTDIVACKI